MERITPLNDAKYAAQTVAYTGTAGTLTGWPSSPKGVLVICTSFAYVRVGEGVTATTADTPIPANVPYVLDVPIGTGSTWTVSAIQVASGGSLYAKPVQA
jgi:hypothetical protein